MNYRWIGKYVSLLVLVLAAVAGVGQQSLVCTLRVSGSPTLVAASAKGDLVAVGTKNGVFLYTVAPGLRNPAATVGDPGKEPTALGFATGSNHLVVGYKDGTAIIYDAATRRVTARLTDLGGPVKALTFSDSYRFAILVEPSINSSKVIVYNLLSPNTPMTTPVLEGVNAIGLSRDGLRVVLAGHLIFGWIVDSQTAPQLFGRTYYSDFVHAVTHVAGENWFLVGGNPHRWTWGTQNTNHLPITAPPNKRVVLTRIAVRDGALLVAGELQTLAGRNYVREASALVISSLESSSTLWVMTRPNIRWSTIDRFGLYYFNVLNNDLVEVCRLPATAKPQIFPAVILPFVGETVEFTAPPPFIVDPWKASTVGEHSLFLDVFYDESWKCLYYYGRVLVTRPLRQISFQVSPEAPRAGEQVSFSATPNPAYGDEKGWFWDFDNDGRPDAEGTSATWTFASPGSYVVRLIVVESNHVRTTYELVVEIR